jgi:hypothetical protein
MRQQTAMSTKTRGAAGIKLRALAIAPQATREPILLLLAAMADRKRAADRRPLAEVEAVGNPGRRALVVRRAAVAGGEVAGEANGADADEVNFTEY